MEHYFTKNPTTKFRIYRIKDKILGNDIQFFTSSGVFSKEELDEGSKLMVENTDINKDEPLNILDLGCAYGFVGISLKKKYKNINVDMIDINNRAIFLAKRNIILNDLGEKIQSFQSDGFNNIKRKYDVILFNPPQSAGNSICNKLIKESYDYLNKNGILYIVARHNKGGKQFKDLMNKTFNNAQIKIKKGKFAVYTSIKYN